MTNPYETGPEKVASTFWYADVPNYDIWPQLWASARKTTKFTHLANKGDQHVFALGTVTVKPSHIHARKGESITIGYFYADANEIQETDLTKADLKNVKFPDSKKSFQALDYQSHHHIYYGPEKFPQTKSQEILLPIKELEVRSHGVPDPNILNKSRINPLEADIVISSTAIDPGMSFIRNDLTESNCIMDNGIIVGLNGKMADS
ncbi:hypothetical protein N7507_011493 [Penicillium longicatenatum]|nr:hypothetical protein N7507_011493 [Penicillium longicatenatum]